MEKWTGNNLWNLLNPISAPESVFKKRQAEGLSSLFLFCVSFVVSNAYFPILTKWHVILRFFFFSSKAVYLQSNKRYHQMFGYHRLDTLLKSQYRWKLNFRDLPFLDFPFSYELSPFYISFRFYGVFFYKQNMDSSFVKWGFDYLFAVEKYYRNKYNHGWKILKVWN